MFSEFSIYNNCTLCPRKCAVNRAKGQIGFCQMPQEIFLARAALHFWEEPCISGTKGSGAVFFSGCNMRCVFCQNHEIAHAQIGKAITPQRLVEIFLELQEKGAHNINLVTPTHYLPHIVYAVEAARMQGLNLPIVYNTSGYESVNSLKQLEGIVDIYLPDFKYILPDLAAAYSKAPDYPSVAQKAIAEMYRQQPNFETDRNGLLQKGLMVRHLLLPEELYNAKKILSYLYDTYHNTIAYSIMSQYTPLPQVQNIPTLNQRVSHEAYQALTRYADKLGIENGYFQEEKVAKESFIPHFGYEGVEKY